MQDRWRLGRRRINREILDPRRLLHVELYFARLQWSFACIHNNDVPQVRKLLADLADLVEVFLLGDDGRGVGVLQPHQQRFVAEGGEQRLRHGARLQDAEEADVQLGHAVHEEADPLAGLNAELADKLRDGVGQNAHIIKGEPLLIALVVLPVQGHLVCHAQAADAVAAHPTDVDRVAGLVAQVHARRWTSRSLR